MKTSQNIVFTAQSKYVYDLCEKPFPAVEGLPKWFKDMTAYEPSSDNLDGKKFALENGMSNATFKKCAPMLDSLTSGYLIPLWADVYVTQNELGPHISWRNSLGVFEGHIPSSKYVENPVGYTNNVFKFMNKWIPRTPNGYSILALPPIGYRNLPFKAIEAVLDTDRLNLESLFPVWLKEDFEGVVEKGTPIVQIIPFKRTDWKSEYNYYEENDHKLFYDKTFGSTLVNNYIKNFWSKKTYK